MKIKPLRIVVAVAYVIMIALNAVGGSAFGSNDVGEQSDQYTTFITPAGYTFSIWGIIFLATLAFAIYQVLPRTQDDTLLDRLAPIVTVAFLTTGIWVPLFTAGYLIAANIVMVVVLLALIATYVVIRRAGRLSTTEQWVVQIPFSIFLGWITVAAVANFALTLSAFGWGGLGLSDTFWAIALLLIAGLIASFVVYYGRGDIAYGLTLVWALMGIVIANLERPIILSTAVIVAVAILGVVVYSRMAGSGRSDRALQIA